MLELELWEFHWIWGDYFSPRWGFGWIFRGPKLVLTFLGVVLVSCGLHEFRINFKETSNSCFDGSIEFETSSIILLHIWFVCMEFQTNFEGRLHILESWLVFSKLVCFTFAKCASLMMSILNRFLVLNILGKLLWF